MPPNEHQRALDLWRSDPTHGLRALSAAQCVSALRALVKSRPSPLFPASFLEEEAPSVDSLRATLSGTDFDLFRVLVRHLHALAKSASLSRPAQCTILAPTLLPPATGPKAQDYSRAAAASSTPIFRRPARLSPHGSQAKPPPPPPTPLPRGQPLQRDRHSPPPCPPRLPLRPRCPQPSLASQPRAAASTPLA